MGAGIVTPRVVRWLIGDFIALLLIGTGVYILSGAW